jgi:hypothetical protein
MHYQIRGRDIEASYDLVIGLNLISTSFIARNLPYIPLYPTNQCLRDSDDNILESHGLAKIVPTIIDGVEAFLDFYVFETANFNVIIGQPWSKLLSEGSTKGQLDVRFGRKKYYVPITREINGFAEQPPDPDPLEQAITGVSQENLDRVLQRCEEKHLYG